jgi:murein DD-endopeptidase MepM/ murein hydrolase activator NlpD
MGMNNQSIFSFTNKSVGELHVRAKHPALSKRSFRKVSVSLFLLMSMVFVAGATNSVHAITVGEKKFFSLEQQRGVRVVRPLGAEKLMLADTSSAGEGSFMELKEYKQTQGRPEVKVLRVSLPSSRDMRTLAALDARDKIPNISVSDGEFTWPIPANYKQYISSPFGYRTHPVTGEYALHQGIDIATAMGTPVVAAHGGVVEEIGTHSRMGRFVKVRHAPNEYSLYSHLSDTDVVQGARIQAGDLLGNVGSTGRSTGPHLDYSLRVNERAVNPMRYLSAAAPRNMRGMGMMVAKR